MHSGVKIAIGGKGGVGKTTVCAVWAQLFARDGFNVLAIDADPDSNLASAFGVFSRDCPQPLIGMKQLIAERTGATPGAIGTYFKLNPRVADLPDKYCLETNGLKLLVLGGFKQPGAGCACPEGAFLKALLTHTILQRQEVVIVDLAAGVEFMGRASVQGIDALVVVVEPGSRSIQTAANISSAARKMGVKHLAVIANKITDSAQIDTIKSQLKDIPILAKLDYSRPIQQADLNNTAVFQADANLVDGLNLAKDGLMDLISTMVGNKIS